MIKIRALVDLYSEEQLRKIVSSSNSIAEVILKLGYTTKNGRNYETVKKRLNKFNISTEHFCYKKPRKLSELDVFCKNSSVTQKVLRDHAKKKIDDSACKICGQSKSWNGKELTMILDHINGDHHDNEMNNLRWICPNCNSQLATFAGRNIKNTKRNYNVQKNSNDKKTCKKICPICNKSEINKNSKMCIECYRKIKAKNIPPREKLEELIYNMPFTKIGLMYGVSDNAVRKWCKKYNLPYKYDDLHKRSA